MTATDENATAQYLIVDFRDGMFLFVYSFKFGFDPNYKWDTF